METFNYGRMVAIKFMLFLLLELLLEMYHFFIQVIKNV
jgi:hypothetical protein